MQFTLFYKGPLRSNGGSKEKQALRRNFHPQLKKLWNQEPLCNFQDWYNASTEVGGFNFVPLVRQDLHLVAQLHITLLRPELPGSIITSGGDIDNRLKTLLDSLKIPEHGALPTGDKPTTDENPFCGLLEDDFLITDLRVETAQLLEPNLEHKDVVVLINVTTVKVATLLGGMELP